jgi:hypothetical protein
VGWTLINIYNNNYVESSEEKAEGKARRERRLVESALLKQNKTAMGGECRKKEVSHLFTAKDVLCKRLQ